MDVNGSERRLMGSENEWDEMTPKYSKLHGMEQSTSRSGGKSKNRYQAMLGHCLVCWVQLWFVRVSWLLVRLLPKPYCSDLVITVSQIPSQTHNHHNFCIVTDPRWQQKDLHCLLLFRTEQLALSHWNARQVTNAPTWTATLLGGSDGQKEA